MINKLLNYFVIILMVTVSLGFTNFNKNTGGDDFLAFAEEMPSIIGGMPALAKFITYPPMAKQTRTEGKVFLLAYITENGSVDDVKVVKGIGSGCDEAAQNAIKKCKFNPGKNKGVAVKVKYSIAVTFKL